MTKKVNKKWIIALAILVLLVVTIVLVFVFLPKKIGDAVNRANEVEQTMFLQDSDETTYYTTFQNNVRGSKMPEKTKITNEINAVLSLNETFKNILHFQNQQLVFVESTQTFQNEYNTIMDNFSRAMKGKDQMVSVMKEAYETLDENSTDPLFSAWTNFKDEFYRYSRGMLKSIKSLNKVIIAGLNDGVINNDYTVVVFNAIGDYLDVINEQRFDTLVDGNLSGGVIGYLNKFVQNNIVNVQTISSYKFDTTLQDNLKIMNEFSIIYNASVKNVIETIKGTNIGYSPSGSDLQGSLTKLKNFLKGGSIN